MKKTIVSISLLVTISVFVTGCGSSANVEDTEGDDWRTTRAFNYLEWNSPDGTVDLLAAAYKDYGVIILAPDKEKYDPFPDLALKDGIHDLDTVEDSMKMKDIDGDGYDDFCVDDSIKGEIVSEVFLYNPETKSFDYSDDLSGTGNLQQNEADSDLSKFAGDWYVDGSLENGHLSINENGHVESYSYDGLFNYEGELRKEEYENPDGTKGYLYNIYDDGGEFVIGFYEPEEEDFYELYSGQDGAVHYVRKDHCTQGSATDNTSPGDETGEVSCDMIVGDWDYQVMDPDDTEKFSPNGTINIADNASYTYTSPDGSTGKGSVRVEYEDYSDGTKLPMFNFYEEGDSFWIGTYYDENEPDTLWIGNGGEERLVREGQ